MSKGKSIFSSPNGSNGEAPANPFASLGGGQAKSSTASPFAAASPTEPESPFGFAAEEESAPVNELPQAKIPEKRTQAPLPAPEENPFQTSLGSPQQPVEPKKASPFGAANTFEDPAAPQSPLAESPQSFGGGEGAPMGQPQEPAPAAAPAQQAASPVSEPAQQAKEQPLAASSLASTPAASAPSSQPAPAAAASTPPAGGQSTRQLELRAIFGSEGEMTRDEILTRAKALPGIREVTVVGAGEAAAIQTIGDVMTRFGYGSAGAWQMTCSGGVVDFITSEGTTLAVLREGRYPAGVWETLMIVARELGKAS